mgnify:CR=1 FL=1
MNTEQLEQLNKKLDFIIEAINTTGLPSKPANPTGEVKGRAPKKKTRVRGQKTSFHYWMNYYYDQTKKKFAKNGVTDPFTIAELIKECEENKFYMEQWELYLDGDEPSRPTVLLLESIGIKKQNLIFSTIGSYRKTKGLDYAAGNKFIELNTGIEYVIYYSDFVNGDWKFLLKGFGLGVKYQEDREFDSEAEFKANFTSDNRHLSVKRIEIVKEMMEKEKNAKLNK